VIGGAVVAVFGLIMYYLKALANFARANEAVSETEEQKRRRMSAHWFYAAALGAAAGAFLCAMNNRADLISIFADKKVELLPVLFYMISILAAYVAWMRGERGELVMRNLSVPLLSAGIAAHTLVVVLMVYIRRLPPAVDLYSTFVFAGWCGALLAYYIERRRKDGVAGAAAALVASFTLSIAYGIGNGFAERLNPITESGLWLSLHVATIVFGYGAVLLAVVIANIALIGRKFSMSAGRLRMLTGFLYGVLATGFVFVAIGILMGGLWAESAWGRFWGWAPKENAALMLFLWCAIALHAKRCGLVRAGGFAALVALSGLVLGWSWVGTNLMGEGLHSYGLVGSGRWFLVGYALLQFVVVASFRPKLGESLSE
jgi:ABC-type transport system involved in cytochrome c biogenesis permease subunit